MSKTYYVVNAVRSVHTRLARAQAPERHRFKQFILGGSVRLLRNRPVQITEEQFFAFKDELKAKVNSGAILVREDSPYGPLANMDAEEKLDKEVAPEEAEKEEPKEEKKEEDKPEAAEKDKPSLDDFVPPPPPSTKKKKKKKGKD